MNTMHRILVVDDERPIRNTLKEILEYEDYAVDVGYDGNEAVELLKKNKYDIVLCDYEMPNRDGISVLEEIKKNQINIPFVMISGRASTNTAVEAIKKGAIDFIEKPIDLNRLFYTINLGLHKINNNLKHEKKAALKITSQDLTTYKVKYICNETGEKEAVMLPIEYWNHVKSKIGLTK